VEGRTQLVCADCGRMREVSGEMPRDYTECFVEIVREDGFVPRPGGSAGFLCGACLETYKGSETRDDEENIERLSS